MNESKALKIILHPHEKLPFNKKENSGLTDHNCQENIKQLFAQRKSVRVTPVNILPINIAGTGIAEIPCGYNKIIFDKDIFYGLAQKMEHWFNASVVSYHFQRVSRNKNGRQISKALQRTARFNYKKNDNEVEIYHEP